MNLYNEVPESFHNAIIDTIDKIEYEKEETKNITVNSFSTLQKVAAMVVACITLSSGTALTVKAYLNHLDQLKNMDNETVIDLYENVFQYDSQFMSRALSEKEESRYSELYDLYCEDMAEPAGEVSIIEDSQNFDGKNIAFCKADGILYLPKKEMNDEQILQMIVFNLLEGFVDYESYVQATNPLYYKNNLNAMTIKQVDEIYLAYYRANTEVSFFTRDLSFSEMGRRKVLKELYKKGLKVPERTINIVDEISEISEDDLYFCSSDCTYYIPQGELSDEQILQLIDFQIKIEYCRQKVEEVKEHQDELNTRLQELQKVKREAVITLDPNIEVSTDILSQPWVKAYSEILEDYFLSNKSLYKDPERYYANVCLIFLNDDEIPEMLFSYGCIDFDYDDQCNVRTYLYTYKKGKAVLLSPGDDTIDDFYGYEKAFSYVEKKSMVYCDYYYKYGLSTFDDETGIIDNIRDNSSRMDIWDLDTFTRTSSNSNMKIFHAVYDYVNEEYMDADFSYEYYINVSDILRDEVTGDVIKIVGEKVDKATYEAAETKLWKGEDITTLQVSDFDKIYLSDNVGEALVRSLSKKKSEVAN